MDIRGKKFLVIGGAGLIGSHTVDALLTEDVGEVIVYDNFVRGRMESYFVRVFRRLIIFFVSLATSHIPRGSFEAGLSGWHILH